MSSFPKLAKTTIAFDPLAGNSEIGQEHPEGNIKKKTVPVSAKGGCPPDQGGGGLQQPKGERE